MGFFYFYLSVPHKYIKIHYFILCFSKKLNLQGLISSKVKLKSNKYIATILLNKISFSYEAFDLVFN